MFTGKSRRMKTNQVFSLLYKSAVSQAGLSGSFSGLCRAASPCMIFSSLVALVLVSRPAKLRQDTSQTLARLSDTEQDIFCQVHVWLMFDSNNGIPARVRLDYVSVWFKNFVRVSFSFWNGHSEREKTSCFCQTASSPILFDIYEGYNTSPSLPILKTLSGRGSPFFPLPIVPHAPAHCALHSLLPRFLFSSC